MKYNNYIYDSAWSCLVVGCEFYGEDHSGGHPQAIAHRRKTGHAVMVVQQFEYYYGEVYKPDEGDSQGKLGKITPLDEVEDLKR